MCIKNNLLIIFAVAGLMACGDTEKKPAATPAKENINETKELTTIQWIDSVKSIGELSFGEVAKVNFRFKNTGDQPLFITDARPGCGCTVADFPKEAIAPGKEATVTAEFDTKKAAEGEFRKGITVVTNTLDNTTHLLFFTGVIKKDGVKKG